MKRKNMVFYCVLSLPILFNSIITTSNYIDNKVNNTNLELVEYKQDTVNTRQYENTYDFENLVNNEKGKLIEEKKRKWINIVASAYTASADECGNSLGITASGKKVSASRGTIATPADISFNTKIVIPELGKTFIAEDRGNPQYIGRINEDTIRIDIYMETKEEAINFGVKKFRGYIVVE